MKIVSLNWVLNGKGFSCKKHRGMKMTPCVHCLRERDRDVLVLIEEGEDPNLIKQLLGMLPCWLTHHVVYCP